MSEYEVRESVTLENHGKKLFAILHRPLKITEYPAVLVCHGYAGTKVGKHRIYVTLAEKLAAHGIACLRLDFRGCGDSEGRFEDTTLEGQISDSLLALNYLAGIDGVDPSRMGILGRSMGGSVAVVAARRYGHISSLALWCPVYHAVPWKDEWDRAQSNAIAAKSAAKPTVHFQGHEASAALFQELFKLELERELAAVAHVPLLHIHSESDSVVRIEHADHYARCRKDVKTATRFLRLQESDHEFSAAKERQYTIEETVEWFQKTLNVPSVKTSKVR